MREGGVCRAGKVTCTVVLGEVVMFHIAEAVASRSPHSGKLIVDESEPFFFHLWMSCRELW